MRGRGPVLWRLHRGGAPRRLLLLGGVLAVAIPVPVLALPPAPSTVLTAPPLPPQPGVPATSCLAQPPPSGWALVARQRATASVPLNGQPLFPAPGYQIAVDPQLPCRMYRARDAQTLERSVDSGRTWTIVFHDAAVGPYAGTDPTCALPPGCALSSQPFTASGIDTLSLGVPGLVALGERGNGDAAVVSYDSGTTWSLLGGAGLSGHHVLHLATARDGDPSHPLFGYAVAELAPGPGTPASLDAQTVYVTSDSGATWQPTVWPGVPGVTSGRPPAVIDAIAVVPQFPFLVYCVAGGMLYAAQAGSTSTGGTTQPMAWTSLGPVPDPTTTQLVLATQRTSLRIFVVGTGGAVHYADVSLPASAGALMGPPAPVWHPFDVPSAVQVTAMAVSPFGNQVLVAGTDASRPSGHRLRVFHSDGAGGSVTEISAPPLAGAAAAAARTPLLPASDAPPPAEAVLQADDSGSFYLETTSCLAAGTSCKAEEQSLWRYTPPPLPPPPPARGGGDTGGGGSQLPQVEPLTELMACSLGSAGASSPLAFDGVNLIYPDPAPVLRAPYTDILDALDARTCLTAPARAVTVHFDPAETQYTHCGSGTRCPTVRINDLTYDATRHVVWFVAYGITSTGATAAAAQAGPPFDGYLFTAPWPTPDQPMVTDVQAHVAFLPAHHENGCGGQGGDRPGYDVSDDSLWTCSYDSEGHTIGDHITASDGADIPDHCFPSAGGEGYPGSPGHLYEWGEDDTTIYDWSTVACTVEKSYEHPPVVEPVDEDEQLVCDPLTFTHLRGWAGPDATVFWLRDAGFNRVEAFASLDATCPLPTALSVVAQTAPCGVPLPLTAQLRLEGPGLPLPSQLVTFSVNGVPAGSAMTGADGRAHLVLPASLTARKGSLTAHFSGTDRLYPSTAGITVALLPGAGCPSPARTVHPPAVVAAAPFTLPPPPFVEPPPVPHPPLAPEAAAQPAVNAGTQVQVEAQAQAQVQSVAQVQPGMMTQPQVRRRLATQGSRATNATSLSGAALRTDAAGLAAVAVLAWWCLEWMPRRAVNRRG